MPQLSESAELNPNASLPDRGPGFEEQKFFKVPKQLQTCCFGIGVSTSLFQASGHES